VGTLRGSLGCDSPPKSVSEGARFWGDDKIPEQLRTHSTNKMTLQFEKKYSTQGSGAPCHVSFGFSTDFAG
jgi:hypothetical protein